MPPEERLIFQCCRGLDEPTTVEIGVGGNASKEGNL